jgi:hypothetical protein
LSSTTAVTDLPASAAATRLHLEITANLGVEQLRQLAPDDPQAFLDEGHDLGAALVTFAELVAWVLG